MSQNRKSWKNVSSRRARVWKRVNQPQEFSPQLKLILLSVVLLLIILVPLFGYYQNNVAPNLPPPGCTYPYVLENGQCVNSGDPYTLIWNGTVTGAGTQTTGLIVKKQQSVAPTGDTNFGGFVPVATSRIRFQEAFCDGQLATFTLARIDFTIKRIGNPTGTVVGAVWSAANAEPVPATNGSCTENDINQNDFGTAVSLSTVPTSYTVMSWTGSFSIVGSTNDYAIGVKVQCTSCDGSNYIQAGIVSVGGVTGENAWVNMNPPAGGLDNCASGSCPSAYKYQYALWGGLTCPLGFSCMNSGLSLNNYATLIANATFPAVMLTTSTITTSTAASKELLFYETWGNSTNVLASKPFAWYLTINATLPQTQNYNPLTDPNTAMVVVVYPDASGNNKYYVYQQKDAGSAVLAASGQSQNPYPTCPQTSTLYICSNSAVSTEGSTNFLAISTLLNYTGSGSNTGGAGSGTPNANSLLCANTTPANLNSGFCSTPGTPQSNTPCSSPSSGICTTNTFPFLNVQGQYYLGFWSNASQTGNILFGTSNTGAVDKRANGVYYWVPNPSCPPTCAVTDTGGFFGWLGKTFSGAVNTVVGVISSAGTWVQNTALGPIGSVLQGMVSWMISQIVNFLNWVGSGFGFPNLGSSLLSTFSDLVTIITSVLTNFVSWVTNTGSYIINTLTFVVNIFANAVIFGLLAFVVGPALTLLNIILLMITLFFAFITPASYLLMMDWAWGILMVYIIGVSGFLWWTDLNVQIFTFVFKMIWKFTELVWRTMVIIKSFIPTEGGTPADLKDPTPSGGPKGGSGSGGKPESKPKGEEKTVRSPKDPRSGEKGTPHVPKSGTGFKVPPRGYGQGAKDGDPMAILLMGFMIIVALYWLSQVAFSPIASVNVVGCIAWSTNCHVQNGVTVGTINTTTFFAYLFDQGHGVRIIFTLFIPLVVIMFAYWMMKNVVGSDADTRGNDFLNIGGTVNRTVERTGTSRRETMRRLRKRTNEN